MNDQLRDKLIRYLDALEAATQKAGDFASAEIPEAIREYLMWLTIERFAFAIAFTIPVIVWLIVHGRIKAAMAKLDKYDLAPVGLFYWMARVGIYAFLIGTLHWGLAGVKVVIAPRVVIVEEIGSFVGLKHK